MPCVNGTVKTKVLLFLMNTGEGNVKMKTLHRMKCSQALRPTSSKFCQPVQPFCREPNDLVLSALCLFFWSPYILSQHWPEEQNRENECVCARVCRYVCKDRKRMSGYYSIAERSSL